MPKNDHEKLCDILTDKSKGAKLPEAHKFARLGADLQAAEDFAEDVAPTVTQTLGFSTTPAHVAQFERMIELGVRCGAWSREREKREQSIASIDALLFVAARWWSCRNGHRLAFADPRYQNAAWPVEVTANMSVDDRFDELLKLTLRMLHWQKGEAFNPADPFCERERKVDE